MSVAKAVNVLCTTSSVRLLRINVTKKITTAKFHVTATDLILLAAYKSLILLPLGLSSFTNESMPFSFIVMFLILSLSNEKISMDFPIIYQLLNPQSLLLVPLVL